MLQISGSVTFRANETYLELMSSWIMKQIPLWINTGRKKLNNQTSEFATSHVLDWWRQWLVVVVATV